MSSPSKEELWLFENNYINKGFINICGIDEAGRGPLAGPVVAAAVILPKDYYIEGLNDSKKLSPKKRDILFDNLINDCVSYGVGFASENEIDEYNILQATFLAMKRAVESLKDKPSILLVDGNRDPNIGIKTELIIGGDGKSASIAAASIIAKVTRDRLMIQLDEKYPEYGFKKHKGYGSKDHYLAILKYGISDIHRKSFLKNLDEKKCFLEELK